MKKKSEVFLKHILECIENIEEYKEGLSKEKFLRKVIIQDAIVRRLEIIGEAVKNLPKEFRNKHREIEWKKIAGLRDVLIHEYFGVDLDLTWDIVKEDLPDLKKKVKKILKEVEKTRSR